MPRDGRETSNPLTQLDHRRRGALSHEARELELLALAARQHGVVSLGQLRGLGFTASAVRMRAAGGRLHRLYRAVYAVGRRDVPVQGRRLAAVLACGGGALLSHLSVAAHHGLRQTAATRFDVTVPRRSALRHRGIRVHRSLTLMPQDLTVVEAVPCTSVARTLLDIAALLAPRPLEKAVEEAEILELYDHAAVLDVIDRAAGQPGIRRLCQVLGIARPSETRTKSDLEENLLALCRRRGLPQPSVNAWILLGGEPVQIDFVWRRQRAVVEVDGFRFHRSRGAFRRDRKRDQLLELEGWKRARFADAQIDAEPDHVEEVIRRVLRMSAQ
jgi:very-short-patch-repair endonuclease/predicted transcriptional regulator of viral defense system